MSILRQKRFLTPFVIATFFLIEDDSPHPIHGDRNATLSDATDFDLPGCGDRRGRLSYAVLNGADHYARPRRKHEIRPGDDARPVGGRSAGGQGHDPCSDEG